MTPQPSWYGDEYSYGSSYISRHWRGDLSLGKTYWINGVLVAVIWLIIWFGAIAGLSVGVKDRSVLVFCLYAMVAVQVMLVIWQAVGIWRSASKHVSRGGRRFWAVVAKIAVCLGVIVGASTTLKNLNVISTIASNSNYWLDPHARRY